MKFPSFGDYDWKDHIEEVFLINKDGACLFYKSYIEKVEKYDENLISGAISLVNIMLKELMKPESREISVIKKKGKLTYLYPSELITGVIFSKKESKSIEFHIMELVIKVEQVFKNMDKEAKRKPTAQKIIGDYAIEATGQEGWLAYRYQYKVGVKDLFGYAESVEEARENILKAQREAN